MSGADWPVKNTAENRKEKENREERPAYFQEALADFLHDAASGDAVRHLLELGYTTNAIMERLDFPTPRERVEKMVYRSLVERGVLLEELPLPEEAFRAVPFRAARADRSFHAQLYRTLRERIQINGEENSCAACPFGMIRRDREARLAALTACLTAKERDYLLGIPWKPQPLYHRLDDRMLEIASCMASQPGQSWKFFFAKQKEVLLVEAAAESRADG